MHTHAAIYGTNIIHNIPVTLIDYLTFSVCRHVLLVLAVVMHCDVIELHIPISLELPKDLLNCNLILCTQCI